MCGQWSGVRVGERGWLCRRGRGCRCGKSDRVLEAGVLEAVHVLCHHESDGLRAGGSGLGYDGAQGRAFEGVGDGGGDGGAVEGHVGLHLVGREKGI